MSGNSNNMAVQIGRFSKINNTYRLCLDADKVKEIVTENEVEEWPICVLSIAGVTRSGKSFLLSFMAAYLEHLSKCPDKDSIKPMPNTTAINWAVGDKTGTEGIWMWNKIFKISREGHNKVALLLVDTQGRGNTTKSISPDVDTQILYLSLSIATIQIHNIANYWGHDDRLVFEVCGYMRDLYHCRSGINQTLFGSLILLYRNWTGDEKFGDRSEKFKEHCTEALHNTRAAEIMEGIDKAFKSKDTFMLPEPSKELKVAKTSIITKDIGQDFFTYLLSFCASLFQRDGCYHKCMDQAKHGKRFLDDIQKLADHLSTVEWPKIGSTADEIKENALSNALSKAKEMFEDMAYEALNNEDGENSRTLLNEAAKKAEQMFETNAIVLKKDEELYSKFWLRLEKDLKMELNIYGAKLEQKISKEKNEEISKEIDKERKITEALEQSIKDKQQKNLLEMDKLNQRNRGEKSRAPDGTRVENSVSFEGTTGANSVASEGTTGENSVASEGTTGENSVASEGTTGENSVASEEFNGKNQDLQMEIKKKMEKQVEEMEKRFEKKQEEMEKQFVKKQEEMEKRFEKKQEEMEKVMRKQLDEVEKVMRKQLDEMEKVMRKQLDKTENRFEKKQEELENGIEKMQEKREKKSKVRFMNFKIW